MRPRSASNRLNPNESIESRSHACVNLSDFSYDALLRVQWSRSPADGGRPKIIDPPRNHKPTTCAHHCWHDLPRGDTGSMPSEHIGTSTRTCVTRCVTAVGRCLDTRSPPAAKAQMRTLQAFWQVVAIHSRHSRRPTVYPADCLFQYVPFEADTTIPHHAGFARSRPASAAMRLAPLPRRKRYASLRALRGVRL